MCAPAARLLPLLQGWLLLNALQPELLLLPPLHGCFPGASKLWRVPSQTMAVLPGHAVLAFKVVVVQKPSPQNAAVKLHHISLLNSRCHQYSCRQQLLQLCCQLAAGAQMVQLSTVIATFKEPRRGT